MTHDFSEPPFKNLSLFCSTNYRPSLELFQASARVEPGASVSFSFEALFCAVQLCLTLSRTVTCRRGNFLTACDFTLFTLPFLIFVPLNHNLLE